MKTNEPSYIQIGTDEECAWCKTNGEDFILGVINDETVIEDNSVMVSLSKFRATQLAWFILQESGVDMVEFVNYLVKANDK